MKNLMKTRQLFITSSLIASMIFGCKAAYYKTMESMGYHKRDILANRVQDARGAQEEAKEQFQSALEKFSSLLNYSGGELQEKYKTLEAEYEKCDEKAKTVGNRITAVEDVSEDLFNEWKEELKQYSNERLRRSSEQKLKETKESYAKLIGKMKRAEKKIAPVLSAFQDQVLYLKHNLNAQAISSLQSELTSIESEVASLITEMEASIREADKFISAMEKR
jgi:hypothetical protein